MDGKLPQNLSNVPAINSPSCLSGLNYRFLFISLNPRAKGRNIVGQQLPTLLYTTCCVRFHTLLHVFGCGWELLRKVWNWSDVSLLPNGRNKSQHYRANNVGSRWARVGSGAQTVQQLRTMLGQQCWELLRPFARGFRLFRTERQYFFPGVAWAAGVKQNIKKRKYWKKTASFELKSLFAVCFDIVWLYSSDQIEPRSD